MSQPPPLQNLDDDEPTGCMAFLKKVCGPKSSSIPNELRTEEAVVQHLCTLKYDVQAHKDLMYSIWINLGQSADSMNWLNVGFQRSDPTSDLRQGIIGLVQLLYLVTSPYKNMGIQMLKSSNTKAGDFPFAATSLNMSLITIRVLNSKKLHKTIAANNSVINVINQFYVGCFLYFFHYLQSHGGSIVMCTNAVQQTENYCLGHIDEILQLPTNTGKTVTEQAKLQPAGPSANNTNSEFSSF